MADYLAEVEHATKGLLDLVWAEHRAIDELLHSMPSENGIQREYRESQELVAHSEDADDMMVGVARYWENYFEVDGRRISAAKEVADIEQIIQVRRMSLDVLAGGLLQVAKQGISITHPPPQERTPPNTGRPVGTQPLAEVVWYARNQALHWEDRSFKPRVDACFDRLAREVSTAFNDFRTRSMALDILLTLGWRTWDDFQSDLFSV